MDVRPSLVPAFAVFGLAATVTPPGGAAIATTIVWVTMQTLEVPGGEARMAAAQRILVIRRDEVPSAPRGTVIVAPDRAGEANQTWRVDAVEQSHEGDVHRVVVVPVS